MISFIITTVILRYENQIDAYNSFLPEEAKAMEQILEDINDEYADPDEPDSYFDSWVQVKGYFDQVYISRQEIKGELTNLKTTDL